MKCSKHINLFAAVCAVSLGYLGCAPARKSPTSIPVVRKENISIRAEYPISLVCLSGDGTRLFDLTIDRTYRSVPTDRQPMLENCEMPGTLGNKLLILYLSNTLLDYSVSGKIPNGIFIVEKTPNKEINSNCHDWFLDRSLFFNSEYLALSDGHSIVLTLGDEPVPTSGVEWRPLNRETWPQWWNEVNSRLHVSAIFEDYQSQ